MATTTVRLDPDEEAMLEALASQYGGKSGALRHALRRLSDEATNRAALAEFVEEWNDDVGRPADDEVVAMIEQFDH